MKSFAGFPERRVRVTRIPDLFFSGLLPDIDDLAELKVTLHVIWRVSQLKEGLPVVTLATLEADETLVRGLAAEEDAAHAALRQGIDRAVQRGSLLRVTAEQEGRRDDYLFVNSARGREALERVVRGEEALRPVVPRVEPGESAPRPNIFELYEQNIGLLQPIIADELKEAEEIYPAEWIEAAFRDMARANARSWRYVRSILERRLREGK